MKYKMLLSQMGMKSGCPDLILEFKRGKMVYIELKTKKGSLSKSQKLWQNVSNALKTPHYILKGEINDLFIQLNNIITKALRSITTITRNGAKMDNETNKFHALQLFTDTFSG